MSIKITHGAVKAGQLWKTNDGHHRSLTIRDHEEARYPYEYEHPRHGVVLVANNGMSSNLTDDTDIVGLVFRTKLDTDHDTDQPRPKDLRDEFAMVALPEIMRSMLLTYSANDATLPREGCIIAIKRAYEVADDVMKVREVK